MREALRKVQNMPKFQRNKSSPFRTVTDGTSFFTTMQRVGAGRPNADLHPDFYSWY